MTVASWCGLRRATSVGYALTNVWRKRCPLQISRAISSGLLAYCPEDYTKDLTLRESVRFLGVGLHTGKESSVTVRPLQKSGFWIYKKSDVLYDEVPALIQRSDRLDRGGSSLSTSLTFKDGQQVLTVEHLFSSMAGIGITAALVEVEGEEIPILDGSALPFVEAFLETGLVEVEANNGNGDAKRTPSQRQVNAMASAMLGNFADITESTDEYTVTISKGATRVGIIFDPKRTTPIFDVVIDFPNPIGRQHLRKELTPKVYCEEIAPARTFTLKSFIDAARQKELIKGGSLENAVVYDDGSEESSILNPDGLRFPEEPVRHKILDAIGDISVTGVPLRSISYTSYKAGHEVNGLAADDLKRQLAKFLARN